MKKHIELIVRRQASTYKFALLICAFGVALCSSSYAQEVQYVVEKEVALTERSKIVINAPKSVRITGKGAIYTRQIGDQYLVSKKAAAPNIFVIDKKLSIKTWNQNAIKQQSKVTFQCETREQEEKLKKALSIKLLETISGRVEVNCELNIDKFQVENSWFKDESNHIILDDGTTYPLKFLSISNTLYIPISSQVDISSNENDITLDRHHGKITITASGGSLIAREIDDLSADIKFAEIFVDQLGETNLTLQNSHIKSQSIHRLSLESATSLLEVDSIENLDITESVNDKFTVQNVKSIKVNNSLFSTYAFYSCTQNLEMFLKNCDVDIQNFGPALEYAYIKNANANMHLGTRKLQSYNLTLASFEKSTFSLPKNLNLASSDDSDKTYTVGEFSDRVKLNIDCTFCDVIFNNSN